MTTDQRPTAVRAEKGRIAVTLSVPDGATIARLVPRIVLVLGVVLQGALLTYFARNFWFAMDDWDMLLTRGTIPGESRGVWDDHNGHPSMIIVVIYRVLFEIFGLRTYLPYALVTIVLHLLVAVALYRLLSKAGARAWPAVIGAWLILFMGAGDDALMYSAAMNHLGSLLLGLLAAQLCLRSSFGRRELVITTLLLVSCVMFSGTGVPVVFFVAVLALMQHGPAAAARLAAIPAAGYVTWFWAVGRHSTNSAMPADSWDYLRVPQLVWQGLSGSVGKAIGFEDVGPALLIAVIVGSLLVRDAPLALRRLAWAGIIGAVAVNAVLATSRMHLDPSTSRYGYFTILFLAPSFVLCVKGVGALLADPPWLAGVLVGVLLVGYAANGVRAERAFALTWESITQGWPDIVLGMVAATDAGERQLTDFSGDFYNGDVSPSRVSRPEIRRALPAGPATPVGRLFAEGKFMVEVGTKSLVTQQPGTLSDLDSFPGDIQQMSGCRAYTASAERPVLVLGVIGDGREFTVTSRSTEITTQLTRGDLASAPRVWPVSPGRLVVSSTAKDALLFVTFNKGGDFQICL